MGMYLKRSKKRKNKSTFANFKTFSKKPKPEKRCGARGFGFSEKNLTKIEKKLKKPIDKVFLG